MNFLKELSLRKQVFLGVAGLGIGYVTYKNIGPESRLPRVCVLDLHGTIMPASGGLRDSNIMNLKNLQKKIDLAFKLNNLQAIILNINSPGGSPVQSSLISKYIQEKAGDANVPVIVFVEDMAASGGYWLACTGSEIYADSCSIVGSIGVISQGLGFHQLIEKWGIDNRTYTAGENKSINNPFDPVKESDVKIIKALLNEIHQKFIDHVKNNRGERLTASDEVLFNGQYWTGDKAKELGLIDGIDHMDSFIKRKWGKEGKEVKVTRIRADGLLGLLTSMQSLHDMYSFMNLNMNSGNGIPLMEDSNVKNIISSASMK